MWPVCVSRSVSSGRGYRQPLSWMWVGGLVVVISISVVCVVCVEWVVMFVVMAMFVVVVGVVVSVCVSFSVRVRVWRVQWCSGAVVQLCSGEW